MIRANGIKITVLLTLLLAVGSVSAFADAVANTFESSEAGKVANRTGIPQLIKMPFKIFAKAGDSMQNSGNSGDDVAVSDVYNLDAETTG